MQEDIMHYLCENRTDIEPQYIIATTPPCKQSRFVRVSKDDPFITQFADIHDGVPYCTVGTFSNEDLGKTCYHGKLQAFDFLYNHLLDTDKDIVVTDCMAGVDNLGTSNFFVHDVVIFVVEPTSKSLAVYRDYLHATQGTIPHCVIVNKVVDDTDMDYVYTTIPTQYIIGIVHDHDLAIRKREKWDTDAIENFVSRHCGVFDRAFAFLLAHPRDWKKYMQTLREVHTVMAREWYNDYLGGDLPSMGDQDFEYEEVLV